MIWSSRSGRVTFDGKAPVRGGSRRPRTGARNGQFLIWSESVLDLALRQSPIMGERIRSWPRHLLSTRLGWGRRSRWARQMWPVSPSQAGGATRKRYRPGDEGRRSRGGGRLRRPVKSARRPGTAEDPRCVAGTRPPANALGRTGRSRSRSRHVPRRAGAPPLSPAAMPSPLPAAWENSPNPYRDRRSAITFRHQLVTVSTQSRWPGKPRSRKYAVIAQGERCGGNKIGLRFLECE